MTTKYFAILTNQGAARLANATMLGTKLNITQMAVGDGNGSLPTPDPAQTKLINQTRIAPINSLSVDANDAGQIIAEQIIPENEGGFFIREIGLYDDDGILIAVANCPETYKPLLAEGSGRTQTIRMILVVSSTSAITLKIDPSVVLATRKYVDDAVIEVKSYVDGLMRNHEQSRNHPDATTTAKGFTQLNSSVTDDRETQSATPKAVKIAMDNANARLAKDRNLADLPNPTLARQNLQLGNSSTKNTGTTANTVAAGDDARITGAMQKSQNGADIQDVVKFLKNIGLTAITTVEGATDSFPYFSGPNSARLTALTDFARNLLSKPDDIDARNALGLKSAALRAVGNGSEGGHIPDMSFFGRSLDNAGYFLLPSGVIVQWGRISLTGTTGSRITYPIPFPNKRFVLAASPVGSGFTSNPATPVFTEGDRFGCDVSTWGTSNYTALWIAIGG
ncbi:phage tail protein [Citrobacter freundii]|uniref:phage tail protein n=1 Tax=Citrobacter freundii TaxID=546 RepID=UPI0021634BEA|nr:phage tail protein [Citrobacter freundii]MCS0560513.1 phage tail protein [Citrobacter freundii]